MMWTTDSVKETKERQDTLAQTILREFFTTTHNSHNDPIFWAKQGCQQCKTILVIRNIDAGEGI